MIGCRLPLRSLAPAIAVLLLAGPARAEEPADVDVLSGFALGPLDGLLVIALSTHAFPSVLVLNDPPRLVVDVPARTTLPGSPGVFRQRVDRFGVSGVRSSQYRPGEKPIVRLVLDMAPGFPPPGDAPIWRIVEHPGGTRILVRSGADGVPDAESEPARFGELPERADPWVDVEVVDEAPEPAAAEPDTLPGGWRNADMPPGMAAPHLTVDPTKEIADARQVRVWNRRARELVANARLRMAAGDHRRGLESVLRILRHYPGSDRTDEAHYLAVRMYAAAHFDREMIANLTALVSSSSAEDSLLESASRVVSRASIRPTLWREFAESYALARSHGANAATLGPLGERLGLLLAEAGKEIPLAMRLLNEAIGRGPDAGAAARLRHGMGLCHEVNGELHRAGEEHLFAAKLLTAIDPARAHAHRLRAADAFYDADDLVRAATQYELVSGLDGVPGELRAWAFFQLGNCRFRTRRFSLAAEAYEDLRTRFPNSFWSSQIESRVAVLERAGVSG